MYEAGIIVYVSILGTAIAVWWLENARRTLSWWINDEIELFADGEWYVSGKYGKMGRDKGFFRSVFDCPKGYGMTTVSFLTIVFTIIVVLTAFIWPLCVFMGSALGTAYFLKTLKRKKKKTKEDKIKELEAAIRELKSIE